MKMKNLLFSGILMAATLALEIGAAVSFESKSNNDVKVAEAAVTSVKSGEQYFIDCSQVNWYTGNAYLGVYFYGDGATAAFSDFTQTGDANHMYRFTVPGTDQTYTNIIALRKSKGTKDWDGEWNRVNDFAINGNGIKITSFGDSWGSGTGITVYGGISSGNQVYVNYNGTSEDPSDVKNWWASGCDNYMFFCEAISGQAGGWVKMNPVQGQTDHLLECTVPGTGVNYTTMIAARVASGETPASDWSNVYNQTVDYMLVSKTAFTENTTKNAIVLENSKTDTKQNISSTYSYSIGNEQRAKWYGSHFINQTNATCSSLVAPSTSVWNDDLEVEYNHMNTAAKNYVKNADSSKYDGTGSGYETYEEAAKRYDLILGKYGYGTGTTKLHDFLDRHPTSLTRAFVNSSIEDNSSAIVVVIASLTVVASLGGYFLLKKKRI